MKTLFLKHQFEIRHSINLDFYKDFIDVFNPYMNSVVSFHGNQDNIEFNNRYSLVFDDNFTIIYGADRILLNYQGPVNELVNKNSQVEDPFFEIFERLQKLRKIHFKKFIFFNLGIVISDDEGDDEKIYEKIQNNFLAKPTFEIFPDTNDLAITLEKIESDDKGEYLRFGPHLGVNDLRKRNIKLVRDEYIEPTNRKGLFFEHKMFGSDRKPTFKEYVNLAKYSMTKINNLWVKIK